MPSVTQMPQTAPPADEGLQRAVYALLDRQAREGFWHEYALEVGSSRAWTTAYIGTSLIPYAHLPRVERSLERAARAILRIESTDGWGYNLVTGSDADSTAWCVRFLSAMGHDLSRSAEVVLLPFVDPNGDVHTFRGESYGSWDMPHDDVAATVALALVESGAASEHTRRISTRTTDRLVGPQSPHPFWWIDEIYLWQAVLVLVDRLNLQTTAVRHIARRYAAIADPYLIQGSKSNINAFRCALGICADEAAARIGTKIGETALPLLSERAERALRILSRLQAENGLWAPSAWMKIPGQRDPFATSELAVDTRGLVTTATCLMALSCPHRPSG
jgi:hypothetical protein